MPRNSRSGRSSRRSNDRGGGSKKQRRSSGRRQSSTARSKQRKREPREPRKGQTEPKWKSTVCPVVKDMRLSFWPDRKIHYLPIEGGLPYAKWRDVAHAMDMYTDGNWNTVANVVSDDGRTAHVTVTLTVECADHSHMRSAIGSQAHKRVKSQLSSAAMVAEKKAFKRAAAMFGIAADLWDDEDGE